MSWDGKIYGKYRIEHADGTPLKGKKYFVLRLDSDDPVEAARVAAAMRAYKKEPRNCDVGTADEQAERYLNFVDRYDPCAYRGYARCAEDCPVNMKLTQEGCGELLCRLEWAQMPYEKGDNK